jgi:branched-chain amino acid transport system substrate-binding protein
VISRMSLFKVCFLLLSLLILGSCGSAPKTRVGDESRRDAMDTELSQRLYMRMVEEHGVNRNRAALHLAYELIDHHKNFKDLDHVYLLATEAAFRLGDLNDALRLSREGVEAFPDGRYLIETLDIRAIVLAEAGDHHRAADALAQIYGLVSVGHQKEEYQIRLAREIEYLDSAQMDQMRQKYEGTTLAPYLGYVWLQTLLKEGDGAGIDQAAAYMRDSYPDDIWLDHAEKLLLDPSYEAALSAEPRLYSDEVAPRHIGVLCPLTGRYTVLGNAFFDGVQLARDHAEQAGWRHFSLNVRDSEGDPVTAAMAARKFAEEDKPIAMIGGLLSSPTVAAALVCDSRGVPLISPTATNERIAALGQHIFQTNVTRNFEAKLLARLVTNVLLKKRIAVLYPETPDGLRSYEVFAGEVVDAGGLLVAAQTFNPGLTDFREPLRLIDEELPEVIYVPADVDQMLMLGPQLDFYRSGALILGPSSWNSPRLIEKVGDMLERAIFPSDAAFYPHEWIDRFEAAWQGSELPREATAIARQSYLASMFLFRTLGEEDLGSRQELVDALGRRLMSRREVEIAYDTMAESLRMFQQGTIIAFPMHLFQESLALEDSLKVRDLEVLEELLLENPIEPEDDAS